MNPLAIVGIIADLFRGRQQRKAAAEAVKGKIMAAKLEGQQRIELSDAEAEAILAEQTGSSWKDEYLTIVITSPILALLIGGVWFGFTGDARLIDGTNRGISELQALGVEYDFLLKAVVLAGIGLKVWRAK